MAPELNDPWPLPDPVSERHFRQVQAQLRRCMRWLFALLLLTVLGAFALQNASAEPLPEPPARTQPEHIQVDLQVRPLER